MLWQLNTTIFYVYYNNQKEGKRTHKLREMGKGDKSHSKYARVRYIYVIIFPIHDVTE